MSTYVLVHGAWHGGWYWHKVVPLLEKEGHKVEAPDLPGHGKDKTPISEITLEAYAQSICKVLDAQSEPVILVGHSMGGIVITQVAEYRPERIKMLVYLTAFLQPSGEFLDVGADSLLVGNTILSEDQTYSTLTADAIEGMYSDSWCVYDLLLNWVRNASQTRVSTYTAVLAIVWVAVTTLLVFH